MLQHFNYLMSNPRFLEIVYNTLNSVSYTHLDVYKRQVRSSARFQFRTSRFYSLYNDVMSVLNCDVQMFSDDIKIVLPVNGREYHHALSNAYMKL